MSYLLDSQPSLPVLYTLSSQATHEAVHLLCRMLVFDPSKRISAKDALAHPYLDEGRLRYHTCMCKCCYTTSSGRVYTSDFEPVTNPKFDDGFEKNLASVRQVKEIIHQFVLEQQKGNRVPLCINPQSAAFKSFISNFVPDESHLVHSETKEHTMMPEAPRLPQSIILRSVDLEVGQVLYKNRFIELAKQSIDYSGTWLDKVLDWNGPQGLELEAAVLTECPEQAGSVAGNPEGIWEGYAPVNYMQTNNSNTTPVTPRTTAGRHAVPQQGQLQDATLFQNRDNCRTPRCSKTGTTAGRHAVPKQGQLQDGNNLFSCAVLKDYTWKTTCC
ncbi:Serine/threonine-protein kinase NLK [Acipenser ruthenus]|uniref:Serine/threonine-protein kinase NLK n=1 Tax=Acipenser ruthenus TaxID=7906 RepID=A0A444U1A5_ACIRT|nr:Serine/threonine-protein kinase NLK [Acipenser ruthenus]